MSRNGDILTSFLTFPRETFHLLVYNLLIMEILLSLSPTEGALLKALCPRGTARKGNYVEATARDLLTSAMKHESRLRKIDSGQVFALALAEAVEKRKQQT